MLHVYNWHPLLSQGHSRRLIGRNGLLRTECGAVGNVSPLAGSGWLVRHAAFQRVGLGSPFVLARGMLGPLCGSLRGSADAQRNADAPGDRDTAGGEYGRYSRACSCRRDFPPTDGRGRGYPSRVLVGLDHDEVPFRRCCGCRVDAKSRLSTAERGKAGIGGRES